VTAPTIKTATDVISLEVAGITLKVVSHLPLLASGATGGSDRAYEEFIRVGYGGTDDETIDVEIVTDNIPDTRGLRRIFDGGGAWGLYAEGEDRIYCTSRTGGDRRPLITARLRGCLRGPAPITLHCNPELLVEGTIRNPMRYPLDQIVLSYALAFRGGIILHAAGVSIGERAYMFPGVSGAGKSTMTGLFANKGYESALLSDDRVVARKLDGGFSAWGTPWPGEAGLARNFHMPLGGVFFLDKGDLNGIKELVPAEAVRRLMPMASVPWYDRDVVPDCVRVLEELLLEVPSYEFTFNNDAGAVDAIEEFLGKH
jgi:hypothetical protein